MPYYISISGFWSVLVWSESGFGRVRVKVWVNFKLSFRVRVDIAWTVQYAIVNNNTVCAKKHEWKKRSLKFGILLLLLLLSWGTCNSNIHLFYFYRRRFRTFCFWTFTINKIFDKQRKKITFHSHSKNHSRDFTTSLTFL